MIGDNINSYMLEDLVTLTTKETNNLKEKFT